MTDDQTSPQSQESRSNGGFLDALFPSQDRRAQKPPAESDGGRAEPAEPAGDGGQPPAAETSEDGQPPAAETSEDGQPPAGGERASGGARAAGNGNGQVLHGSVVTDDDMAASERAREDEQAVADRRYVPPAVWQALREQLADFAEFAHRERLGMPGPPALGSGGGITAAVVRELTALIRPSPDGDPGEGQEDLTDVLGALVAPAEADSARAGHDRTPPGGLKLDVATVKAGTGRPSIRLIQAELNVAGDATEAGPADTQSAPPCAAMIVGSAADVAGGRPYLSIDALTGYARREAFRQYRDDTKPETARTGMRAARNLEIVVLLDTQSGTGVWVDVDPDTGRSAAAFSIHVGGPVPRRTVRFTGLAAIEPGPALRPSAARATLSG